MKNIKQLNLLLLIALFLMTGAVLYKWNQNRSLKVTHEVAQEGTIPADDLSQTRGTIQERNRTEQISAEQIDQQYEQVKFDRLIMAMRGHHSRDLQRVVAEGLDFTLLPDNAKDELQQVAKEEDFQSLIAPLFENK